MNFQDASNLRIPEGYVRTIHDKNSRLLWGSVGYDVSFDGNATQTGTPTPDSPQPISVVTGENVVKVVGKNLAPTANDATFTSNDVVYTIQDGVITIKGTSTRSPVAQAVSVLDGFASSANYPSYVIMSAQNSFSLPAGTYTISATVINNGNISNGNTGISVGVGTIGQRPSTTTPSVNPTTSSRTFTVEDGQRVMLVVKYEGSSTAKDIDTTISNVQIELGSTATTYQAYTSQDYTISLGELELAKIGTYQDRIYKVGDTWYIRRAIGKVVLDGSETWTYYSSYGGFRYRNNDFNVSSNNPSEDLICSHFTVATVRGTSPTAPVIKSYTQNTDSTYIFLCDGTSDVDAFKQWLSTHPTTVYYALATPTTTEITDATLIAQLEAVYDWVRRHGYNASVTGNLPIVINRTALPTA